MMCEKVLGQAKTEESDQNDELRALTHCLHYI